MQRCCAHDSSDGGCSSLTILNFSQRQVYLHMLWTVSRSFILLPDVAAQFHVGNIGGGTLEI